MLVSRCDQFLQVNDRQSIHQCVHTLEWGAFLHLRHPRAQPVQPRENGLSREPPGHFEMCHDQPLIIKGDLSKDDKRVTHDTVSGYTPCFSSNFSRAPTVATHRVFHSSISYDAAPKLYSLAPASLPKQATLCACIAVYLYLEWLE